jgi:hypothetical protein
MDNLEKLETLGTHDEDKQNKKHNTICIGNHYTQTDRHDITEILLKVALNTIILTLTHIFHIPGKCHCVVIIWESCHHL